MYSYRKARNDLRTEKGAGYSIDWRSLIFIPCLACMLVCCYAYSHTLTHTHLWTCTYTLWKRGQQASKNHVYVSAAGGDVGAYLVFCSVVAAAPIIAQAIKNALFMRRNWTPSNRPSPIAHRAPPNAHHPLAFGHHWIFGATIFNAIKSGHWARVRTKGRWWRWCHAHSPQRQPLVLR